MRPFTNLVRASFVSVIILAIAACSTTPQDAVLNAGAKREFLLPDNYQLVYRRVYDYAKPCLSSAGYGGVSMEVEGQLYPDLNSGQITYSQNNLTKNYFVVVKINKVASGSRVTISAANMSVNEKNAQLFEDVARGNKTSC